MMMFSMMSVIVGIGFFVVFALIAFAIGRGFAEWSSNNQQDVVNYKAKVVAKRQHVTHTTQNMSTGTDTTIPMSSSSSDYYITFQDEYGARQEFRVKDRDYGLIAEGDTGTLSHQGTRFLGFERERNRETF